MPDNLSKYIKNASPEEKRANASKAGKRSVEVRQQKKLLKDYLSAILEKKTDAGCLFDEITIALVEKALEGDVRAYHEIRDTIEGCEQKVNIDTGNTIKISITGDLDEKGNDIQQ